MEGLITAAALAPAADDTLGFALLELGLVYEPDGADDVAVLAKRTGWRGAVCCAVPVCDPHPAGFHLVGSAGAVKV